MKTKTIDIVLGFIGIVVVMVFGVLYLDAFNKLDKDDQDFILMIQMMNQQMQ